MRPYRSGPLVWLAIIAFTCLLLLAFQKVLWLVIPALLALIIYYLLQPLQQRLVLAGVVHETAAVIIGAGAFAVVGLVAVAVAPSLAAKMATWNDVLTRYFEAGYELTGRTLTALEDRFAFLARAHIADNVTRTIRDFFDTFAQKYLTGLALTVVTWLPAVLLAPFFAFFLLRDGLRFKQFICRAIPNAFIERALFLLDQMDRTARLYFLGLIKLAALDAAMLTLGLWLIGISGAGVLGVVTAILAWVPYIGPIVGCILVVLVAATDNPGNPALAYAAVGLFILVRLLDDFVFMPMTVGRSLRLHPLVTVLMIFVGGAIAGIAGLLLVLPVLGIVAVVGETLGQVLSDPRLRARHQHACRLLAARVNVDLT